MDRKFVDENKHAYLIMAHHRPDLLKRLIHALDDERNDIFIHIDLKSDMKMQDFKAKRAGLYFIERMDVHWAGYSQIECAYRLLETAVSKATVSEIGVSEAGGYETAVSKTSDKGKYAYYHLLTGASYPLWNQDYLHDFFDRNAGKNFVGFDNKDFSERARYYFFASEYGKPQGIKGSLIFRTRSLLLSIQKSIKYDRLKKINKRWKEISSRDENLVIKKGLAYWSLTHEAAEYILKMESFIKNLLKHSISGDEIFVQTLIYNSEFRNTVFSFDEETTGASRLSAWESSINKERAGYNFIMEDIDFILESKCSFAFKFESEDGIKLIDIIDRERIFNR
ncbi:MAG: beta-1,6-N-acetylglucosaminyltransferase [Eubacteriales bacterium]|nr:beta-1,6-N-acetylglucosaminyltransferase [Eubacteriales bacterium]